MKADLHCHTNLSDGLWSFEHVLDFAVWEGVDQLAITNHDTTRQLEEMIRIGKQRGVEIVPGIEISAMDPRRAAELRILGYYIEPEHAALEKLCEPIRRSRFESSRLAVSRLRDAGYAITWEQVLTYAKGGTSVFHQHIMQALVAAGYTQKLHGELYERLFANGARDDSPGIAYMPPALPDVRQAVQAVVQAGGVPVLSCPARFGHYDLLPELMQLGLSGIEVWHPQHSLLDEAIAERCAVQYGLIATGGSNFHGYDSEREVPVGSGNPGAQAVRHLKARAAELRARRSAVVGSG